jgi:TM2 domain-containing membrane protein YozV
MNSQQMLMMLPGIQPNELHLIQSITKEMTEAEQQQFFSIYSSKRKEQQTLLIMSLIGFLGIAGIHRFVIGQLGMGIIYLLTGGFCGIGTIIDIVNMSSMTFNFNQKQALETANMVKMMSR